jgi:hypothetical protein
VTHEDRRGEPGPEVRELLAHHDSRDLAEMVVALHRLEADARAELGRLREGQEPYIDERLVPTPGQWIWLWNRATPAERLQRAQRVLDDADKARDLYLLRFQDGGPVEPGTPLCTASWDTPDHGRANCWRGAEHEPADFHTGETVGGVRYQWRDGLEGSVPHGAPKVDADPHGLKAGMVVRSYHEYGQEKWVFRCWGTDDGCNGLLSLDHGSQQAAEGARDRHVAEEHTGQPKERP